jgi:radical SAM superfamily enzyme YgiQ (UPF0313 family)
MKPTVLLLVPPALGLERGKGAPSLPLSLVYAAALLPDTVDVRLIDLRLTRLTDSLLTEWRAQPPLCVGLTAITGAPAKAAAEVARRSRAAGLGPIVWGGKHATLFGQDLVRDRLADVVVVGDGEQTFAALVDAFVAGGSLNGVPGLWLWDGQGAVATASPTPFPLEQISRLPFGLLKHDYLYRKGGKATGVLETSRGCPGRCTYCYLSPRVRPYWHGAPAAWVADRLAELRARYAPLAHVDFVDDNFFADRARALAVAAELSRRYPGLTWTANGARLRDMAAYDDAELRQLARAGLDRVDLGIETGSPRLAAQLGKAEAPGEVPAQIKRLLAAGIRPWVNLMVGFAGETEAERGQTFDLALDATAAGALVSPIYSYAPYPGTKLADEMRAAGHVLPQPLELVNGAWNRSGAPWVDRRLAERLAVAYTASLFIDDKLTLYRRAWTSRILLALLRPLSRWRLRRRFFGLGLERALLRLFVGRNF